MQHEDHQDQITTTKRVVNSCNEKRKEGKMMINMRTVTKRSTSNYKHKKCKTRTTKIKITMIRKVVDSYNEEKEKGKWLSTWGLRLGGLQRIASIRDVRREQPRSWPRGLLVVVTKKEQAWNAWNILLQPCCWFNGCLIRKTHMYNYIKSYYVNEIIYLKKKEIQYQCIQLDHETK